MKQETGREQKQVLLAHIEKLNESARVAVETALKVREGERVLIVGNPPLESYGIALALHNAVAEAGGIPLLLIQPVKSQLDFADDAVIQAISSEPDVFISISSQKLGKDRFAINKPYRLSDRSYDHVFTYLMAAKKLRAFWSPAVTQDMFVRTVPIDYTRLAKEAGAIKSVLDPAEKVRIQSPGGTDIMVGLRGRTAFVDDGDLSKPGTGGNLPAGETFISPELGASEGKIVFDGSLSLHDTDIIVKEPVSVFVEKGFVRSVEGGEEAARLEETIEYGEQKARQFVKEGRLPEGKGEMYRRNARNLGELGIGLNPSAEIYGQMLEDEKAYRTCHLAIGANYDEDAPALIHLDCLMRSPTITAYLPDGRERTILRDGGLCEDLFPKA